MSYYLNYNGIDLTDIVKVRSVEMPALPDIKNDSIEIFERDGEILNGVSYGTREITLSFLILLTEEEYDNDPLLIEDMANEVKRAFLTKEEAPLYVGRADRYIMCVPEGTMTMNELRYNCYEFEIKLIAYNPWWCSDVQNIVNNENKKTFNVNNESDLPIYPLINIGFSNSTTFLQMENQANGKRLLVGGIPSVEGQIIERNSVILQDEMETTTGWQTSSSLPLDTGKVGGGTLTTTVTGTGLRCGDFGSSSSSAETVTWHGVSAKKSLPQPVKSFSCRIRMTFNSTGTNGDPEHPVNNKPSNVITGSQTIYYITTSALNLRESASESSKKLLTMPQGTKLHPTSITNGWAKVSYSGKTGYCSTKYLQKMISDTTVTGTARNMVTTVATAIRTTNSTKATNLKTIPAGTVVRCITNPKLPNLGKADDNVGFYKMEQPYKGFIGYVYAANFTQADNVSYDYNWEQNTSDDKTGVCQLYGYSNNNVQLFSMTMQDSSEWYEHNYPIIRKNSSDFLVDEKTTPAPKTVTTISGDTVKVERRKSGKYGSYTEFYGEFFIERTPENQWSCYVQKITDGQIVKEVKSSAVVDTKNADEKLSYLVLYIGTTGDADKASGMSISFVEVKTLAEIDNQIHYNFIEMKQGDILSIDNSIPEVRLNGVEHPELVDVGSQFFPLELGDNTISVATDDPSANIDFIWKDKYL